MGSANAPKIRLEGISDQGIRDNFKNIGDFIKGNTNLVGFKHIEVTITGAQTEFKIAHGLGFLPKDVVQTSLIGAGALTWNYSLFTTTDLVATTTGTCTVRAYIGTHIEGVLS